MRGALPALVVALAIATAAPAMAEPAGATPGELAVLVVPLVVGTSSALRAAELESAVASAIRGRARLRVMSSEEAFVAGARLDQAGSCGGDLECLSKLLARTRADLALVMVANAMTEPPLLALRLVEVSPPRMLASSAAPLGARVGATVEAVTARVSALLDDAGFPREARVVVEPTPADARITVAGAVRAEAHNTFVVTPGVVVVRAERSGFVAREVQVLAEPAEVPQVVPVVLEEEPLLSLDSPWLWTAIVGVVVISGATAIYLGTQGDACVCVSGPAQSCPPC